MKMHLLYEIGRGVKMEIELVRLPGLNRLSDSSERANFQKRLSLLYTEN